MKCIFKCTSWVHIFREGPPRVKGNLVSTLIYFSYLQLPFEKSLGTQNLSPTTFFMSFFSPLRWYYYYYYYFAYSGNGEGPGGVGRWCFHCIAHSIWGVMQSRGKNAFSTLEVLWSLLLLHNSLTAGAVNFKIGRNIAHIAKGNSTQIWRETARYFKSDSSICVL